MPPKRKAAAVAADEPAASAAPAKRGRKKADVTADTTSSSASSSASSSKIAYIKFEHCISWSTYKSKAKQIISILSAFGQVKANDDKPRKGAFDVTMVYNDGKEDLIWNGVTMGPPRKLKFIEHDDLIKLVQQSIEKH